jgi:hypothetical protein
MKRIVGATNGTEGRETMSSAAKEFEEFARDCVRLAGRTDTPELREKLREWMQAVMEDEGRQQSAQSRLTRPQRHPLIALRRRLS